MRRKKERVWSLCQHYPVCDVHWCGYAHIITDERLFNTNAQSYITMWHHLSLLGCEKKRKEKNGAMKHTPHTKKWNFFWMNKLLILRMWLKLVYVSLDFTAKYFYKFYIIYFIKYAMALITIIKRKLFVC